jgi:hypothetical protein
VCCRYTTTPCGRVPAFPSCRIHAVVPPVVAPRVLPRRHPVISRVRATGPRLPSVNVIAVEGRDGRTRTCGLVFPKHMGWPLPYIPICSRCCPFQTVSGPYGNRTRLTALKGRYPQTDRRTGRLFSAYLPRKAPSSARTFHAVGREVLEPSSAAIQAAARPSSATDPTKKARRLGDTGLRVSSGNWVRVSQAQWIQAERIHRLMAGNPPCIASFV